SCSVAHPDLHSFPTRRSSDLGLERPMLGLDPDLASFLDHVHRPILVGELDVSVLQHDLEAVGVARLGQEPPGLGPVLLGVPSEADRKSTRLNSSHLVISYAVF